MQTHPKDSYPRERCLLSGADSLSLRECLALILGTGPRGFGALGVSSEIVSRPGDGLSSAEEERAFFTAMESGGAGALTDLRGLGPAGRAKLLAAFEIGRRYAIFRSSKLRQDRAKSSSGSERSFAPETRALGRIPDSLRMESREWLGFVALYRSGNLGDLCIVERGVRTHVNIDPAELFARILALRPSGFILFHNHPSGETTPSQNDADLTMKVAQTARALGIRLLGHWIVSPREDRWIPPGLFH